MKCLECNGSGNLCTLECDHNKPTGCNEAKNCGEYNLGICPRCKGTVQVDIYTERRLKVVCSVPEFKKWLFELAFEFKIISGGHVLFSWMESAWSCPIDGFSNNSLFPLLIHRAVEGFNNKQQRYQILIDHCSVMVYERTYTRPIGRNLFSGYQPESLTHAECAMLHCLLNIFKER